LLSSTVPLALSDLSALAWQGRANKLLVPETCPSSDPMRLASLDIESPAMQTHAAPFAVALKGLTA